MESKAREIAESIIQQYNACFTERHVEKLRDAYVEDGPFSYFDNHSNCDSIDLQDHLTKVGVFFKSGDPIAGLDTEILSANVHGSTICVAALVKYKEKPEEPVIRLSLMAELHSKKWRIRHLHFSATP